MFKLIATLIPFIRELFFDKKEEMDFNSRHFNSKKWIQYMSFIILFTSILFVGGRLFSLTIKYIKLEADYKALKIVNEKLNKRDSDLEARLDLCENKLIIVQDLCVKKPPPKGKNNGTQK